LQQASAQVDQAKAQLLSARSEVNRARAQVKQTQAARDQAAVNLSHTIIRAPIDGVVIGRDVDVGQTVAASFQAPTLFLLANDLTRMRVLADIDEADVGQLGPDSRVSFTVDAYPGDEFHGRVSQVRLNPQTVQNVVTYTAVVDVANPEMKLKPGMTANVTAVVAERPDVLKVPNAALRFQPEPQAAGPASPGAGQRLVWKIEPDGKLRPVPVRTGLTDGVHSEVLSGQLQPGDLLATGQSTEPAAKSGAVRNPMMPMGRGGRR
jgi:HlyD family secretion protein